MKKNMQMRLVMITLTILFMLTVCGAVSAESTTTTLTFSENPTYEDHSITLTAHLTNSTGPISGRTVRFYRGSTYLGQDNTNSNGYASITYTPHSSGDQTITATFSGSGSHGTSSDTQTLHVAASHNTNTDLTLSHTDAPGNQINLTARLTSGGNPLSGQTIRFSVDGTTIGTGTTNANGYAYWNGYTASNTGGVDIRASFAGGYVGTTDYYRSSSDTDSLYVYGTSTSLTLNQTTVTVGNPVTLRTRLTNSLGIGMNDQIIHFLVDGVDVGSATTNWYNLQQGWASITYTPSSYGIKNVQAFFFGDLDSGILYTYDYARESHSAIQSLTVNGLPTTLSVDPASGYKGYSTTLRATLTSGGNLAGKTINFFVNGVSAGSGVTGSDGVATCTYNPITQNVGSYIGYITAVFDGDSQYLSTSGVNDLTVVAIPTSMTVNSTSGYKSDHVTLSAKLWDTAHDKAVVGKNVDFYVHGVKVGTGTTGDDGYATCSYTITDNIGIYTDIIGAVFAAGDDQFAESSGNGTLTVNAIPTSLTVNNVTGNKGHSVDLKATLWDTAHDKAVAGKTIIFKVNGVTVPGTATTDANGVATLSYYIDLVGGTYNITAEFAADSQYSGSIGNGTLKVPQSNVYVITTVSKNNPAIGETITITFKLGNRGPDGAEQVIFTYVIPDGLQFVSISGDGNYSYDPATRTITWNLGDVPANTDPYLYLLVKPLDAGSFNINPGVSLLTYDPDLSSNIQFATIDAVKPKAHAASKTIPLQPTGLPLAGLVLAVLAVFGGLVTSKKF